MVWQSGAPGRIRTSDRLVRSQVLYPAELRARFEGAHYAELVDACQAIFLHSHLYSKVDKPLAPQTSNTTSILLFAAKAIWICRLNNREMLVLQAVKRITQGGKMNRIRDALAVAIVSQFSACFIILNIIFKFRLRDVRQCGKNQLG